MMDGMPDERLHAIKERYVDWGSYFVINRGWQYGKTATLRLLAEYLKADYCVLAMDFQKLDSEQFKDGAVFSKAFAGLLLKASQKAGLESANELTAPIERIVNQTDGTKKETGVKVIKVGDGTLVEAVV